MQIPIEISNICMSLLFQLALSQDIDNPLKWIYWVDDVGYEKAAVMKLVLIVEKALPNENKLHTYLN